MDNFEHQKLNKAIRDGWSPAVQDNVEKNSPKSQKKQLNEIFFSNFNINTNAEHQCFTP
jgi:hypothetical protein